MSVPAGQSPSPPLSFIDESSPPPPPTTDEPELDTKQEGSPSLSHKHIQMSNDLVLEDILLWRRKVLNISVLSVATALWVLLQIYQFNFITVASWAAMFVISSLFFLGNISRLLGKEPPNLSVMEIDEASAAKMANTFRKWVEDCERWMFRVAVEKEWYIFVGVVANLYLFSLVAQYFDFITLVFIGVVSGLSVPMMYMKYEDKIKELGQRLRMQGQRCYGLINEKLRIIRHKMVREEKLKKTE